MILKTDAYNPGNGLTYDPTQRLTEANESNNVSTAPLTLPIKPDLTVTALSIGTITKNADNSYSFPVTFTVANNGGAAAQPFWEDVCYLSSNTTLDSADIILGAGGSWGAPPLAAGSSYTQTITCETPASTAPGTRTLLLKTDAYMPALGATYDPTERLTESNDTNNVRSISVTLP